MHFSFSPEKESPVCFWLNLRIKCQTDIPVSLKSEISASFLKKIHLFLLKICSADQNINLVKIYRLGWQTLKMLLACST